MATLSDYVSGTITLTNGSVDFSGSATGWLLAAFKEGDTIIDITGATEFMGVIAEITSNTAGKLTKAWEGPDLVDAPYRMRYQADGSRVSAQARNLIELLGDGTLTSLAGLSGPGVIELLPGGGAQVVPKTDLVSGANYDVQVDDLTARATYDGQAAGFSVLVSDVGDGRSAIYSKASNASADWTDPAFVTGPVGPTPVVTVGTVTTGAPGTDADVTETPTVDGVELDFTIPAGQGFSFEGAYSGATAYAEGDVVRSNGSSWIALQATTGNAPPTLPTTSNAYWELLAQKGQDGTGTGDVVGPAGATDGRLAAFDGPTGKLLKELTSAQATATLNAVVGDSGSGGTKGLVPAPAAGDAAAKKFLRADGTWAPLSVEELEFTVSQLALGMADALNVAQFLGPTGNRLADSFDTLTYVDVAGGTNLDTTAAGVLKATKLASTSYANAGGSGNRTGTVTPTSSLGVAGGSIGVVINGNTADNTYYWSAQAVAGHTITFDFGAGGPYIINEAKSYTNAGAADGVWQWQGSNNGTSWDNIGATETLNGSTVKTYTALALNSTAYRYYRLLGVSGSVAGTNYMNEFEFKIGTTAGLTTNNLTVRSAAFTAASVPTKMKALINVKEVEASVAGTDYTLECSRDSGTTWTAMTLTERYTMPTTGLRVVEAAETDVTGQPSGSAPRWRFKTLNNKNVELHDVYLYWS